VKNVTGKNDDPISKIDKDTKFIMLPTGEDPIFPGVKLEFFIEKERYD